MISEIPEDVPGRVTTRLTTQEDGRYSNDNRRHRKKNRGDSRYYTVNDLVVRWS